MAVQEWRLDAAEKLLKSGSGVERDVLLARIDLQRSRFAAVDKRLSPVIAKHPEAYEARVVLGRALYAKGDAQRAFKVLDAMAEAYNNDKVTQPEQLLWLGVGLHLTDYPKNALQVLDDALKGDAGLVEARLQLGALFMSKYNMRDADQEYKQVLAKRKDDVRALLGLALIDIESDRAYSMATERANSVLARAPKNVDAHNILARIDLDNERPRDAIERLEKHSLAVAPKNEDALALLGAANYVADDTKGFKAAEKLALAANPRFARFYTVVGQHAARVHRYAEAIALNDQALKLDKEHWQAYAGLGIGFSRVGDDAKAKQFLEKAYDGDPYEVRTYNLLDRFYDRVIKQFEWVESPPLRVRVHKDERAILERYVPPLLHESYEFLKKKYSFTPKTPLHVEIFADTELFSVRSTGLPRLGAHGICFGHVITARSPSAGNFNWAEVLWHELSHVFHIQLSDSRVPRWFTEGMAVYESTEGRPEWRREMDAELLEYREMKKLRGVGDFNLSFTMAKSLHDILIAYYHAYVVGEFISKEFGAKKVRAMLVGWGKRKTTEQVVKEVLGFASLKAFDDRFFAWLDKRLAPLAGNIEIRTHRYGAEPETWIKAAEKAPKDIAAQVAAAQAAYAKRDAEKALAFAEAALKLDPKQLRALLVRATLRLGKKDRAGAKADLEAILAAGGDGVRIREHLAAIAQEDGNEADAAAHLEKAIAANPQEGSSYYALIKLLDTVGREADAYAWRRRAVMVDQNNVKLADELLAGAEKHGASLTDVMRWGELGDHVGPFSAAHHAAFAKELLRLGKKRRARFAADSALLIDAENADAKAVVKALGP